MLFFNESLFSQYSIVFYLLQFQDNIYKVKKKLKQGCCFTVNETAAVKKHFGLRRFIKQF